MNLNEVVSKIKSKNWTFYVSRKFHWYLQHTQILANSKKEQEKYLGFSRPVNNYLIINGDEYFLETEQQDIYNFWDKQFLNSSSFFERFADGLFRIVEKINKHERKHSALDLSNLSNDELANLSENFFNLYVGSFIPAWTRPDSYLEKKIKELLIKDLGLSNVEAEKAFASIATYPPLRGLAYSEEPLKLLLIAKEIKESKYNLKALPKSIKEKINQHVKKYSWLKGPVLKEEIAFSKEEYMARLEEMLSKNISNEINRILKSREKTKKDYDDFIKEFKPKNSLLKLIEALRVFMFLRTFTTEASDHLFFLSRKRLINEIAKRINLPKEDIVMLESNEKIAILKGDKKNYKKIIKERKDGFAIIWVEGHCYTFFGKDTIYLHKEIEKARMKENKEEAKFIKGSTASFGKVTGKAKILKKHDEVHKVNKGDILVASMTTPDYIMAMEKAAAFVTDEVVVTCHAAILAREFGVPCIVGTSIATKTLKDGDRVEVDADNGIVKILSREK